MTVVQPVNVDQTKQPQTTGFESYQRYERDVKLGAAGYVAAASVPPMLELDKYGNARLYDGTQVSVDGTYSKGFSFDMLPQSAQASFIAARVQDFYKLSGPEDRLQCLELVQGALERGLYNPAELPALTQFLVEASITHGYIRIGDQAHKAYGLICRTHPEMSGVVVTTALAMFSDARLVRFPEKQKDCVDVLADIVQLSLVGDANQPRYTLPNVPELTNFMLNHGMAHSLAETRTAAAGALQTILNTTPDERVRVLNIALNNTTHADPAARTHAFKLMAMVFEADAGLATNHALLLINDGMKSQSPDMRKQAAAGLRAIAEHRPKFLKAKTLFCMGGNEIFKREKAAKNLRQLAAEILYPNLTAKKSSLRSKTLKLAKKESPQLVRGVSFTPKAAASLTA